MKLHELKPNPGSVKNRKRLGRGTATGQGKTAGRGMNGQKSRSGGGVRPGFEGGQTPLFKRLPKRGFTNVNRKEYAIINVEELNCFKDGSEVSINDFVKQGLINKRYDGIKVLGNGKLSVKLTVKANKFSKSAEKIIADAGGKTEVI